MENFAARHNNNQPELNIALMERIQAVNSESWVLYTYFNPYRSIKSTQPIKFNVTRSASRQM